MDNVNNKCNSSLEKSSKYFGWNLLYLLMSMPLGILYFTFVVVGISMGAGVSILYIGIPIMAGTLVCARKILYFEKNIATRRLNTNAGVSVDKRVTNSLQGEGTVKRMLGVIKNLENWRCILYCIVKLPISILNFTVATCLPVLSIGLIFSPVVYVVSKKLGINMFENNITMGDLLGVQLPDMANLFLYLVLGLGIGYLTVKAINALAKKSYMFTLKF